MTCSTAIDPAPAEVTEPAPRKRGGGPRTPEGKARSSRNAMTHGLRAEVLVPEDLADALVSRTADLVAIFRPDSDHAYWLVGQVALAEVRLDCCRALELAELRRRIDRAELHWDDDRRAEAEALGATLARDPSRVARTLRTTRQGALWLLERWAALAEALERSGTWDEPQRRLALDLLGVPTALRDAWPDLPPEADLDALRALVERERLALSDALAGALDLLDESEREQAAAGLAPDDADSRRLRRYEASLRRSLTWALDQLRQLPAAPEPAPAHSEIVAAPPPFAPPVEPVPDPSADAEADPIHPRPRSPWAVPDPVPASQPGNRRARRHLAKLARQSDRHGQPDR